MRRSLILVVRDKMKSILFPAMLFLASCAHEVSVPEAPELPYFVNAYIGYEPIADMSPETPGDIWYYRSALQVDGAKLKLHKSPVFCRNNQLQASESDGGFFWYQGSFESAVATLTYEKCDYCIEPAVHTGKFGSMQAPISFPSPGIIQLGGVRYNRNTSAHSSVCP